MKAVIGVAVALFLLALNISQFTGLLVNDVAAIREQRVELYLNFPQTDNPVHKQLANRARDLLRMSAYHDYFTYDGIMTSAYFEHERELVSALLVLSCLRESDIPGRVITPDGISIVGTIESIGVVPCDPALGVAAETALGKVLQQDYQLVRVGVENSACKDRARNALLLARDAITYGFFDTALTNLQAAWYKAQC